VIYQVIKGTSLAGAKLEDGVTSISTAVRWYCITYMFVLIFNILFMLAATVFQA
jgi:hypothetical protein